MLPTLEHFGVACIPWSPLARGVLTHPFSHSTTRAQKDGGQRAYAGGATEAVVNRVEEVAKRLDRSMAQVGLGWIMAKSTAPVVGSTSLKNLQELIGSVNTKLSDEDIKCLEKPYLPRAVVGHE